jgi:hypothetical protein
MRQRRCVESDFFECFDEDGAYQKPAEYKEKVNTIQVPEPWEIRKIAANEWVAIQQQHEKDGNRPHDIESEYSFVQLQVNLEHQIWVWLLNVFFCEM